MLLVRGCLIISVCFIEMGQNQPQLYSLSSAVHVASLSLAYFLYIGSFGNVFTIAFVDNHHFYSLKNNAEGY